MNQSEEQESVFPIVEYRGSSDASIPGDGSSSACPDSLASIVRDTVFVTDVLVVEPPRKVIGFSEEINLETPR